MTWIMEISLSERKNYEIWLAIADNRIADALQHLKTNVGEEKRTWLSIFKKPEHTRDRVQETGDVYFNGWCFARVSGSLGWIGYGDQ